MSQGPTNWTEEESVIYQQLAVVAVPDREEQMATIATLLPFDRNAAFTVVELGSGEGFLSEVILECFPNASVLALDGSEEMRTTASRRLDRFVDRFRVESFNIEDLAWIPSVSGVGAVVSSLCVHHLDNPGKQEMFRGVADNLAAGGALIVADLVASDHPVVHHYLAESWDAATRQRSLDRYGGDRGWQAFQDEKWNIYRWPDEMDRPASLADQLAWLRDAGFATTEAFWMRGAHAIYGGYLAGGVVPEDLISFEAALGISRRVSGTDVT